jgi:curved DNA-binding protein CbpA
MGKLHTHYDNLKVSRDAPEPVIKAAYKVLAQANHPDRCRDPEAPRRMQIINDAYAVLSNSSKRKAHDKWIVSNEKVAAPAPKSAPIIDRRTTIAVDSAYVEKLHAVYRAKMRQNQEAYSAEIAGMKRVRKIERLWGLVLGFLIATASYCILSGIETVLAKDRVDQAQQYKEASMLRH